jgi:gliding motility-associated lipoprotein GldH
MRQLHLLMFLLTFLCTSCDQQRVYEANVDIGEEGWRETQIIEFNLDIKDASLLYNIFYNVRYTNNYQNYNLYVKNYISDTSGKEISQKLQGMDLFRPTTGIPFGSGLGGNYDYKILGLQAYKFPHPGQFTFRIKQYMRQDPLKGITAFGIRLEKDLPK